MSAQTQLLPLVRQVLHDYLLLFAMVNVVGNLPVFADLVRHLDKTTRNRTFRTAVAIACSIVVGFAFFGDFMLRSVFQVDIEAFKVAGGILVFAVAARGVLSGGQAATNAGQHYDNLAVFPLSFPFLAGPGTIVTTILLMQAGGRWVTAIAAVLVYLTVIPVLHLAGVVEAAISRVGILVVTRILYVFICAKAVAFVLSGLRAHSGMAN